METVSPNIFVNDIKSTIEFYKLLGFNIVATVPEEGGELVFALMMNGETTFMFQTFASIEGKLPWISRSNGGSLLLYVKLKGIRRFYEEVSNKVKILTHLETTFYGATEFSILDNNNYMLTFAEDE